MAKRGRPFKFSLVERVKWVGFADEAKRLALPLARMQQLRSDEEESLAKAELPRDLQDIVKSGAPGRHDRYLDAMALKSALAPPLAGKLRHLFPKEPSPGKWTAEEEEGRPIRASGSPVSPPTASPFGGVGFSRTRRARPIWWLSALALPEGGKGG